MYDVPDTLVTFDFEGRWGMPFDEPYDLGRSTNTILEILERYGVSAMFFVVGRLIEEEPDLIATLAKHGHAIGLHGYRHEHLDMLTPKALAVLQEELESVCELTRELTGTRPLAFRAPYLLGPKFHDAAVTKMLGELGIRWTSNREIRFPEEIFRPDRIRPKAAWQFARKLGMFSEARTIGSFALILLNAHYLWRDPELGPLRDRFSWLLKDRRPFQRSQVTEVALGAPLDCDLLGLPLPSQKTPSEMLSFATETLILGKQRQGNPHVLTFHDWIIGSNNRHQVLENVLKALSHDGTTLDALSWLPTTGRRIV